MSFGKRHGKPLFLPIMLFVEAATIRERSMVVFWLQAIGLKLQAL
jgi:hypothetical protein